MADGYTTVVPTPEEAKAYRRMYGRKPTAPRLRCNKCGRRIWGNNFAVGKHRKACKGRMDTPLTDD